jgi:SEL1 protein
MSIHKSKHMIHVSELILSPYFTRVYPRYQNGIGLLQDTETAAQYAQRAVAVAAEEFHRVGGQPVMEGDRITDDTEKVVAKGNSGNDDELITDQKIRAEEGDVPAMMAMGDLYYYGARGLPRDQPRALQYYSQAAAQHDPNGLCGAAAMYLKGEGTDKNVTKAVDLYEEAAALGSVKALNGLGYIYFYGQALPKNEVRYLLSSLPATDIANMQ